jgi:NADPH:quinone reductase-like Zn-dependent oxidoreductase
VKAILIREFGPPGVMRLEEVPTPVPGPGEVLIAVHAVSVNRTLDLIVRAGRYPRPVTLPHVPGVDPSGAIVAVGEGVADRKVGDRVATTIRLSGGGADGPPTLLGVQVWGGYAEYVKVPAAATHRIPDNVDFATATCVVRHAPTAFHLLRDRARLKEGEWVLVMGASGGLGSAGVQVAKALGAHVIAGAGADERVAAATTMGADAGVNYRASDLAAEVRRITHGRGVDVVFENIADPDLFPKALASLARFGRLVTAGGHGGGTVPLDVNRLYLNQLTIIGATGDTPADAVASLQAASEGRLTVLIDQVLPLSQAVRAHELVTARESIGKIVLDPTRA